MKVFSRVDENHASFPVSLLVEELDISAAKIALLCQMLAYLC